MCFINVGIVLTAYKFILKWIDFNCGRFEKLSFIPMEEALNLDDERIFTEAKKDLGAGALDKLLR